MATVADYLATTLAAAGVKRVYGVVGDSLNGFTDSLRRQGEFDWIHTRHEGGPLLPPVRKLTSRVHWRCAPVAAGRATCT